MYKWSLLRKGIVLYGLLCNFLPACAQYGLPPSGGLSLSASLGQTQFKEPLLNNLRNTGFGASLYGSLGFNGSALYQEAALGFNLGVLQNRYEMESTYLAYSLHYKIMKLLKNKKVYIGGLLNYSSLLYTNEYFDGQHNYWLSHIDLGISTSFNYPISSNLTLSFPFSLPVTGLVSRPTTNRDFVLNEPDLKVGDVLKRINSRYQFFLAGDKLFFITSGMFLDFKLRNKKTMSVGYHFHFEQSNLAGKMQRLTHSLLLRYPFTK